MGMTIVASNCLGTNFEQKTAEPETHFNY